MTEPGEYLLIDAPSNETITGRPKPLTYIARVSVQGKAKPMNLPTSAQAPELIESMWDAALPSEREFDPADRVRAEFRTFLQFTMEHTAFHHFMLRENQGSEQSWRDGILYQ